jgi:hypothetical protein
VGKFVIFNNPLPDRDDLATSADEPLGFKNYRPEFMSRERGPEAISAGRLLLNITVW